MNEKTHISRSAFNLHFDADTARYWVQITYHRYIENFQTNKKKSAQQNKKKSTRQEYIKMGKELRNEYFLKISELEQAGSNIQDFLDSGGDKYSQILHYVTINDVKLAKLKLFSFGGERDIPNIESNLIKKLKEKFNFPIYSISNYIIFPSSRKTKVVSATEEVLHELVGYSFFRQTPQPLLSIRAETYGSDIEIYS